MQKYILWDYSFCVLMAIFCALMWELFYYPAIAFILFCAQLFISKPLKHTDIIHAALITSQIIILYLLPPDSYLFTILYLLAGILFFFGKLQKGIIYKNIILLSLIGLLGFKPGYLLLLCMKYQRLLNYIEALWL